MVTRILVGVSALLAIQPYALGQGDLLDRFQSRYRSAQTIRCSFATSAGLAGRIVAKRGGSYMVTLPDRTLVSDGRTVWSASPSAKTVIINSYKSQSNDLSLEKVFFDIMNIYQGQVIQRNGAGGIIRLTPPDARAVIAGVTRADITLNASTLVTGLLLTENGSTASYTITSLTINPKIKASTFTYSPPKGWEVIDLR
ncbi:MAG: outer membrane lipoprotein carrier protein LolA [Candidatus Kapabacteria bacterium]|nr:outer membrane lipoprotein carrier protein LolA [Candidatus Kapabacteria bacterium]